MLVVVLLVGVELYSCGLFLTKPKRGGKKPERRAKRQGSSRATGGEAETKKQERTNSGGRERDNNRRRREQGGRAKRGASVKQAANRACDVRKCTLHLWYSDPSERSCRALSAGAAATNQLQCHCQVIPHRHRVRGVLREWSFRGLVYKHCLYIS